MLYINHSRKTWNGPSGSRERCRRWTIILLLILAACSLTLDLVQYFSTHRHSADQYSDVGPSTTPKPTDPETGPMPANQTLAMALNLPTTEKTPTTPHPSKFDLQSSLDDMWQTIFANHPRTKTQNQEPERDNN